MKILKTFLLAIFAVVVRSQADPDQTVEIQVKKYKAGSSDPEVDVENGKQVKFKFLAAGEIDVLFKEKDADSTSKTLKLNQITKFAVLNKAGEEITDASIVFGNGKIESSTLLAAVTGKTKNFKSKDSFAYNGHYLKHGIKEVIMTVKAGAAEFKEVGETDPIASPNFEQIKLHKVVGDAEITEDTTVDMSAIVMERYSTKTEDYTVPAVSGYKMKVWITEYFVGDTSKTPTSTKADTQNVKFVFPEEKKDDAKDGGIQISFNDGASDQLINLYDSKPKMTLNVMQGETSVSFESAKLTLGKYKLKLEVRKDNTTTMDFEIGNDIFLTETVGEGADAKTTAFDAVISSGVPVAKKETAVQAWVKPLNPKTPGGAVWANVMALSKEFTLNELALTLTKETTTKETIKEVIKQAVDGTTTANTTAECKNGVSHYVLAPLVIVASLASLLA